ncbi:hypothetical protein BDY24DRAFT_400904 [Mrakia frigida]|uniref:uncharacterized protein n=1 Tax=Mrakia frigida TaxID=29902 RepID=UPI003FCC1DD0
MSHTSPYHQQPNLPQQQQDQHAQAPAGLSPAFLASLQSLYPSVSPTSKTAQDIAAYLNGTASISYESRLDSGFQQQMNANVAPPQSLVQARAIETLLAQAKHAQQHAVSPSSPQGSYPTYALSSSPYFTDNSAPIQRGGGGGGGNVQPSLFNQQPIQPPSLPFNLFPYQQYLQQHQQRFQPQYSNFSNFQQQHQQSTQYQTPFYPPLPFLAPGEQQHSQYNTEINSSSSTNSTVESPSLPELGQDFIYDPSFDLSGASNDFEDANVSPFGAPSQLANGGYKFYKSPQGGGGGYAPVQQQQQPFDMASLDTDSPLTSSSPSS